MSFTVVCWMFVFCSGLLLSMLWNCCEVCCSLFTFGVQTLIVNDCVLQKNWIVFCWLLWLGGLVGAILYFFCWLCFHKNKWLSFVFERKLGKSFCQCHVVFLWLFLLCPWLHCNFDSFWKCSVLGEMGSVSCTIACSQPFKNNDVLMAEFCWVFTGLFIGWSIFGWTSARNFACLFPILVLFEFHFPNIFAMPNAWFCQTQIFWFVWWLEGDSSLAVVMFTCSIWFKWEMIDLRAFFPHSSICWHKQQLFEFNTAFSGLFGMIWLISHFIVDCQQCCNLVGCWLFCLFWSSFFCSFLLNFWEEIELCCWNSTGVVSRRKVPWLRSVLTDKVE